MSSMCKLVHAGGAVTMVSVGRIHAHKCPYIHVCAHMHECNVLANIAHEYIHKLPRQMKKINSQSIRLPISNFFFYFYFLFFVL